MTPVWKKIEIGSIIALAGAVVTFYVDWKIDENAEESVMFDNPKQKITIVEHGIKLPTSEMEVKLLRDEDFQKEVLEELRGLKRQGRETDSIARLAVYITNKAIKKQDTLSRNLEHTLDHVHQ